MRFKPALIASFILHSILFFLMLSASNEPWQRSKKSLPPIEAHLIIKNKNKNKELLPKKVKAPPASERALDQKNILQKDVAPAKSENVESQKKNSPEKALAKSKSDSSKRPQKLEASNLNKLSSLSEAFAKELATEEVVEPEGEVFDDSNYFDQVYTLIKESFIVPPHLDGPRGQNLQAVLRIFLASDGSLNKIEIITPSGDEHFDKAVVDGTKRVKNFGAVPIFLRDVLRERGLVVELCPVKCKDR